MKKNKYNILVFIIIVSFLYIQISYNGTPSISIFTCFIAIIYKSIGSGWNFSTNNFVLNYTYYLFEFLLISISLIVTSIIKKRNLILLSTFIFLFMWALWLYMLKPLIEFNIYLISSIPFLISIVLIISFLFYDKKKTISQKSSL
jgi:hypothetical protein